MVNCKACFWRVWVENAGIRGDYTGWAGCGYRTQDPRRCNRYESVQRDLKPDEKCEMPCPMHDVICCVVGWDPEMLKGAKKVFGDHIGEGSHAHLCLFDMTVKLNINKGMGVHSWHDGETAEDIENKLKRLQEAK